MSRDVRPSRGLELYRRLLWLYPADFRRRFEPEMIALFAAGAESAGPAVRDRLRFWCSAVIDLLRSAARERFHSEGSFDMATFGYDVRQAWHAVSRAPLLSAFVVLLMALSIGSTTAVFSIVNAVLLRPFPFAHPDRLVMVWERRSVENTRNNVGGHEFPEWKARSRSFEHMAAIAFDRDYNLTGAGEPVKLSAARVTSEFFAVMGVPPQSGRAFVADEDQPGRGDVAVIGDALWRSRFNADPGIVGRTIQLNGRGHTIVGVMPASFVFPQTPGGAAEIWIPIAEPIHLYRGRHYLSVVARLREGVTRAEAQNDMDAIAARVEQELPQFSRGHGVNVQPLHGEMIHGVRRALLVLFTGVALVLLIGCCNVANLLLARAASRQQEIAIRVALGADRWRIARQLLAEGSLLAVLGGAGGVLLAAWLITFAKSGVPGDVPRLQDAALDPSVLAFAALVSLATATIFGIVPLAQAMRIQVAERLTHGAKGAARPPRQPLRRTLVIAEVALTVMIATGAGLFLKSFNRLLHVDPGFETSGILAAEVTLPSSRYSAAPAQRAFVDEALTRIGSMPGVVEAAATNLVPHGNAASTVAVAIEGQPAPLPGHEPSASYRVVTPGYFTALDIPILAGRTFTAQDARVAVPLIRWFPQQPMPDGFDRPQPIPVAVINESMARQYWPALDPIGRRFTVLFSPPITVIGIVKDTRNRALADEPGAEFYLANAQEPQSTVTLLVRARDLSPLPAALRAQIWSIDRDLPVAHIRTLAEVVDANLALFRAITSLMSAFAAMALLLMTLGVYAVVSYSTAQRTYEIGVRLALGAQRRDIRRLVVVNAIGLAAAGIAIGGGGAYALARFASNMLYEISPSDPLTYAALSTLVLAITMVATWIPARRAQRVDPVAVLRNE